MGISEKMISDLSNVCVFYTSDSLPPKSLFGYEKQMRAGLALGSTVAKGDFKTVLVFGYPGTGKGAFPLALARELNKYVQDKFSLLKIHCDRILVELRTPKEVYQTLSYLYKKIERNRPAIVALDELEALSYRTKRMNVPAVVLFKWVTSLITEHLKKVMIIGISSYPQEIDKILARRFCVPLYFEATSVETIREVMKYYLGESRYKAAVSKLIEQLTPLKLNPTSSEIIHACSVLKKLDIATMSDDEIVYSIRRSLTPSASTESIKEYRSENKMLREFSARYAIPYWSKLFEKERKELSAT